MVTMTVLPLLSKKSARDANNLPKLFQTKIAKSLVVSMAKARGQMLTEWINNGAPKSDISTANV